MSNDPKILEPVELPKATFKNVKHPDGTIDVLDASGAVVHTIAPEPAIATADRTAMIMNLPNGSPRAIGSNGEAASTEGLPFGSDIWRFVAKRGRTPPDMLRIIENIQIGPDEMIAIVDECLALCKKYDLPVDPRFR